MRRRHLAALLVPSDDAGPCRVLKASDRSSAISDILGGGAIDEVISGAVDGHLITVYARDCGGLANHRAGIIAARPGYEGLDVVRQLRGHVLTVGQDRTPAAYATSTSRAGCSPSSPRPSSRPPRRGRAGGDVASRHYRPTLSRRSADR